MHHSRWRQDAGIHVIDSHHIVRRDSYGRRGKRDVTSTDRRRRLQGVARDCGHACHLRLRSDDAVYIVHLHRWNQIPDSHNKYEISILL